MSAAVIVDRRHLRPTQRGFSLVELMAVVVITGILAISGVTLFRSHMVAARGSEAVSVVQAIRSAEESYMAENHQYLNVSTASGGTQWYPQLLPGNKRSSWVQSGGLDYARWRALAPAINQSVMFSYLVNAGVPGTTIPALQLASPPTFAATQPLDWYVIQARGDTNGNGLFASYAATSMNGEMYVENATE